MYFIILRIFLFISIPSLICGAQPDLQPQGAPSYLIDGTVKCATGKTPETVIPALISAVNQGGSAAVVHIDYPFDKSVFPPEIIAPTFLWHDSHEAADVWLIKISFEPPARPIYVLTSAEQPEQVIDSRAISQTNKHYQRPDYDKTARGWIPDSQCWESIKKQSVHHPATVQIYGFSSENLSLALSAGEIKLQTSPDPVGAPIFYRDVPLMPPKTGKIIQPLAPDALDLIEWRLRDIAEESAPTILADMPTCANCHSFSMDGSVLGMDLDGPSGDKGAYGLTDIEQEIVIKEDNIITWNSYEGTPEKHMNFGLFSQVSPDGRYVISTLNEAVYVVNYKDFGFGQAFYPTRGILVVYDRETDEMKPLPGACSTNYVQTNATWTPDGKHLIFSRAPAKDKFEQKEISRFSGDERETQIQYDLYCIPFNDGKGGVAVPLKGASKNGMSNSFPKVSPDGRWLVFVQAKNGQLMRPDSKLYILPIEGGEAREMNCNLKTMNSWHSWSPNSKWMVFSSKGLRPFTQMFLTHINDQGMDTPAILIPNSTADNRAVNIPEFLNGPGDAIKNIRTPTQRPYKLFREATDLATRGRIDEALDMLDESISLNPYYDKAYFIKGKILLQEKKQFAEAKACFEKVLEIRPDDQLSYYYIGGILEKDSTAKGIAYYKKTLQDFPDFIKLRGRLVEIYLAQNNQIAGIEECRKILEVAPEDLSPRLLLGSFLFQEREFKQGVAEFETALKLDPENVHALIYLAWEWATSPQSSAAQKSRSAALAFQAASLSAFQDAEVLDVLAIAYASTGNFQLATTHARTARTLSEAKNNSELTSLIDQQIACFESGKAWTERQRLPGFFYSSF